MTTKRKRSRAAQLSYSRYRKRGPPTMSNILNEKPNRDPFQSLLRTATLSQLQDIVLELTHNNAESQRAYSRRLTEHLGDVAFDEEYPDDGIGDFGYEPGSKEACIEDNLTCLGCGVEFVESANRFGACSYFKWHPEDAQVDDDNDFWAHTDFDCHDVSFDENPEGYFFPCCEGQGTAEGCHQFLHVPDK